MTVNALVSRQVQKYLKQLFFFSLVSSLVVAFIFSFVYQPGQNTKAQAVTMTLTFDPSAVTAPSGQSFSTTIKASPLADLSNMRGFDFRVDFDKSKMRLTNIEYLNGATVTQGYGDDASSLPDINANRGYINLRGEYTAASGHIFPTSGVDVVRLSFSSASSATSLVSFAADGKFVRFDSTTYILTDILTNSGGNLQINPVGTTSSPTQTPTPTITPGGPTQTPTPTITPGGPTLTPTPTPGETAGGNTRLNLKLKFQGILKKPDDKFNSLQVKITAVSADGTKYIAGAPFVADDTGLWSATVPILAPPGTGYKLFIKGPKHIQKRICESTPVETFPGTYHCENGAITLTAGDNIFDLSGIYLLDGDLPQQDGIVNSYDISLVRNNVGNTDPSVLALADLNLDGIVDSQDYSLVIAALSVRSDEGE